MSDTKLVLKVVPPTIRGPQPLAVDGKIWTIPALSRAIHAEHVRACYVLTPDGAIHCLLADGEVPLPKDLQRALKRRYFML
jgi:hypothetical protein